VVALLHLSLNFIPVESETSDVEPISRSGTCAFSVPLIHFPPSTYPEFIAFLIPPDAVAAAAAAADQHRLDCVYDINTSLHAPPVFICSTFHHTAYPTLAEHQAIAGSSLAAAASQIFGLSLEAPADAALHLLDQGDGVFDRLSSLELKLWLINGQYPSAVQNMLLLIAATHYLVRATAVTENALVNCSVAPSPAHTNVPPTCMQLLYIHKRFVFPIPSRYNDNMVPFGLRNFSADIEAAGGHYFATLLQRQAPWAHMIPDKTFEDEPMDVIQQWSALTQLETNQIDQQKLKYRLSNARDAHRQQPSRGVNVAVKDINLDLAIMPLEEQVVLDRCIRASVPHSGILSPSASLFRCIDSCDEATWSLTVVLGLHRRPANFHLVFQAILDSSAAVSRVVFTLNGSPFAKEFRLLINEARRHPVVTSRRMVVDVIESSAEVGFYFRFSAALLLDTQYVAVVDDDIVLGPRFLSHCLKLLHTKQFYGLLGARGDNSAWGQSGGAQNVGRRSFILQGVHSDDLWSVYVMPSSWVKLLFRERLWTTVSGEDMSIARAVRKYLSLPAFVVPGVTQLNSMQNRSWIDDGGAQEPLHLHRLLPNRHHGPLRASLRQQLWWRGDPLLWTHTAASNARMVVLSSVRQAEALLRAQPSWMRENPDYNPHEERCMMRQQHVPGHQREVLWSDAMLQPSALTQPFICSRLILLPGCSIALAPDLSESDGDVAAEELIIEALHMSQRDAAVLYSPAIHRMLNGWDAPAGRNDARQVADVLMHLGTVLRAARPSSLLVFNDGSPVAAAAVLAAKIEGVRLHVVAEGGEGEGLYSRIADAVAAA
jgi:hypothetical protein